MIINIKTVMWLNRISIPNSPRQKERESQNTYWCYLNFIIALYLEWWPCNKKNQPKINREEERDDRNSAVWQIKRTHQINVMPRLYTCVYPMYRCPNMYVKCRSLDVFKCWRNAKTIDQSDYGMQKIGCADFVLQFASIEPHTHTHVKRTYTHQTGQCVCCFLFPLYCKMLCVFVDFSHFLRLILRCADLFFIRFPYFSAKSLTLSQTLFSCAFCCFASGCERARVSGFWVFV